MPQLLPHERARSILNKLHRENPEPKTELVYENAYTLLVAVMLSAQATDVSVNKATPGLFNLAKTPEEMIHVSLFEVEEKIKTIGLYKTKAKNLLGLSHILVDQHGGHVPNTRDALEALPGVGRKTANVVLSIAFGEATLAVDTHIHRVANRTGMCRTKNPLATEQALLKIIPAEYLRDAHHLFILHGRYVCKARKPACDVCTILAYCAFEDKTKKV